MFCSSVSITHGCVAMDDDDYRATKFTTASVTSAPTQRVSSAEPSGAPSA
jgi:hypothetical protein